MFPLPKPKSRSDALVGSICLLVSLIIYFIIIPRTVPSETAAIWAGHPLYQQPNIIPKIWTTIMIFSSLFLLVQSFISLDAKTKTTMEEVYKDFKENYFSVAVLIGVIILFILLLPVIGFLFSGIIFLAISMWWFGYRSYLKTIVFSIAGSVVIYFFFVKVLNVLFP